MTKIIINADDFGANPRINKAIENSIDKGLISSTTILANGNAFEEVKDIVNKFPNISYGVHLNLVEFFPLSEDVGVFKKYGLIANDGSFVYQQIFKIRSFPSDFIQAIKNEFRLQIQRIKDVGINISHMDGHQHCHTIYPLQDIVIELAKEFNITKIRRKIPPMSILKHLKNKLSNKTNETKADTNPIPNIKSSTKTKIIFNYIIKHIQFFLWMIRAKQHFKMTDDFTSYTHFIEDYNSKNKKNKVLEVMCHPGLEAFDKETLLLQQQTITKIINFELISYHDI